MWAATRRSLQREPVEVYAAFRRKSVLATELQAHYQATGQKFGADRVYDDLVTAVFTNRLHLAAETRVVFARRGKADRNVALAGALGLGWRAVRTVVVNKALWHVEPTEHVIPTSRL